MSKFGQQTDPFGYFLIVCVCMNFCNKFQINRMYISRVRGKENFCPPPLPPPPQLIQEKRRDTKTPGNIRLNNISITIKFLSTAVLIVMTQHSTNHLEHPRKIQCNPSLEMVHCKDSFSIFEYSQIVFAVPPRKIRNIILP